MALGEIADKPQEHCPLKTKPDIERACNVMPCSSVDRRNFISDSNSKYIVSGTGATGIIRANVDQDYIQPSWKLKTVKLKVGGQATIYEDTKIKIRCPVKKFKR